MNDLVEVKETIHDIRQSMADMLEALADSIPEEETYIHDLIHQLGEDHDALAERVNAVLMRLDAGATIAVIDERDRLAKELAELRTAIVQGSRSHPLVRNLLEELEEDIVSEATREAWEMAEDAIADQFTDSLMMEFGFDYGDASDIMAFLTTNPEILVYGDDIAAHIEAGKKYLAALTQRQESQDGLHSA